MLSLLCHQMSGIVFGERVVEIAGIAKFTDELNQLAGEIHCNANSGTFLFGKTQTDDIRGSIVSTCKSGGGRTKPASVAVQGSWLTHLQCDGQTYWHIESEPAFAHRPVANPLASDCRFREDLIALQQGNLMLAQSEKLRLEELQRYDRKLRGVEVHQKKIPSRRASRC
jgi:hypothetical protein